MIQYIIPYFILAHLLGDFVFQPKKLVMWKLKSKFGVLIHVLIHLITSLLLLSPFIIYGDKSIIWAILAVIFLHFWIDVTKIKYDKIYTNSRKPIFLIDQFSHFALISSLYFIYNDAYYQLPSTTLISIYTNVYIIAIFSFALITYAVYRFLWPL